MELELRQDRYDRAISWLKAVQKGDVAADLPEKPDETAALIKFGSNPKKTQHF